MCFIKFMEAMFENFLVIMFRCCFRYNGNMRESMFSVGLQRIAASDVDKVKQIVNTTFDKVIQ